MELSPRGAAWSISDHRHSIHVWLNCKLKGMQVALLSWLSLSQTRHAAKITVTQEILANMKLSKRKHSTILAWLIGLAAIVLIGVCAAWQFSSIHFMALGKSEREFMVDIDYDRFRQIMVRTNVADEMISASGLKLENQQIENLVVNTSKDDRPLIHALLGKSKTELEAEKHLVVAVKNSEIDLDSLALTQNAEIGNDLLNVRTFADKSTGKLEAYETTLNARREAKGTLVKLSIQMKVKTLVPRLFQGAATRRVQTAADKATQEQEVALRSIVAEHASERMIAPRS